MLDSSSFVFRKHVLTQHRWLDRLNSKNSTLDIRSYMLVKRVIDIVFVVSAIPLVMPLMLLCISLVKLENPRAPVFFIQSRTGKGGNRFGMYKFRTMVPNAEELKKQLVPTNADGELAGPLKLEHDPRITRVGRVLRKTSLDELPQLMNVLKGEMSLVGPRPTSFGLKSYMLWQTERLDVIPGITGLWQLYGRGDINFDTWLYWDNLYIEKRSMWLDFQIILRTIFAVFGQRGAH